MSVPPRLRLQVRLTCRMRVPYDLRYQKCQMSALAVPEVSEVSTSQTASAVASHVSHVASVPHVVPVVSEVCTSPTASAGTSHVSHAGSPRLAVQEVSEVGTSHTASVVASPISHVASVSRLVQDVFEVSICQTKSVPLSGESKVVFGPSVIPDASELSLPQTPSALGPQVSKVGSGSFVASDLSKLTVPAVASGVAGRKIPCAELAPEDSGQLRLEDSLCPGASSILGRLWSSKLLSSPSSIASWASGDPVPQVETRCVSRVECAHDGLQTSRRAESERSTEWNRCIQKCAQDLLTCAEQRERSRQLSPTLTLDFTLKRVVGFLGRFTLWRPRSKGIQRC